MGIALLVYGVALLGALGWLVRTKVMAFRKRRRLRNLPAIKDAMDAAEVAERVIELARISGDVWTRGYALSVLNAVHESGLLDEDDYLRMSASVVDWLVDSEGVSVRSRVRRRLWSPRGSL